MLLSLKGEKSLWVPFWYWGWDMASLGQTLVSLPSGENIPSCLPRSSPNICGTSCCLGKEFQVLGACRMVWFPEAMVPWPMDSSLCREVHGWTRARMGPSKAGGLDLRVPCCPSLCQLCVLLAGPRCPVLGALAGVLSQTGWATTVVSSLNLSLR